MAQFHEEIVLQAQRKALEQKKKDLGLGSGPLRTTSEKDKKKRKVWSCGGCQAQGNVLLDLGYRRTARRKAGLVEWIGPSLRWAAMRCVGPLQRVMLRLKSTFTRGSPT
jgi:hypothetical protein